MVNNSVAVQRGKDPSAASVEFFWGRGPTGEPAALLTPTDGRGWFWLRSGVRIGRELWLFAAHVEKAGGEDDSFGFREAGAWLIRVENPDDRPTEWRSTQRKLPFSSFTPTRNRTFGTAVLQNEGWIYVYGVDEDLGRSFPRKHAMVARVAQSELGEFGRWRFYGQGRWQEDPAQAARIFDRAANEYSVSWLPSMAEFISVYTENGLGPRINARLSARPEGPWSEAIEVYECPEMQRDKGVYSYEAKAHLELSLADEIIVTYVVNAFDFWHGASRAELYWPRFLRARIANSRSVNPGP